MSTPSHGRGPILGLSKLKRPFFVSPALTSSVFLRYPGGGNLEDSDSDAETMTPFWSVRPFSASANVFMVGAAVASLPAAQDRSNLRFIEESVDYPAAILRATINKANKLPGAHLSGSRPWFKCLCNHRNLYVGLETRLSFAIIDLRL